MPDTISIEINFPPQPITSVEIHHFGPAGPKGEDGAGLNYIGTVANAAALPGSYAGTTNDAYVTDDTGRAYKWAGSAWLDVGQFKGDIGPVGPQGPAGNDGADSTVPGPQGPAGVDGTDGNDGAQGAQGPSGPGVPTGGTAGQMLAKVDGSDFNAQWVNAPTGDFMADGSVTMTGNLNFSNINARINRDGDLLVIMEAARWKFYIDPVPGTDDQRDLGHSAIRWRTIHVNTVGLKSPNGTLYNLTVDDAGNLVTTAA